MKKTYISPDITNVVIDTPAIMGLSDQNKTLGTAVKQDGATDTNGYNENQFSNEYRSSLWGE